MILEIIKKTGIILLFFTFCKCASLPFDKNPPFVITKATADMSNKAINISYTSIKDIKFKSIYFHNQEGKVILKSDSNGELYLYAKFKKNKTDIKIYGDSEHEFGNKPQPKKHLFPFKLKNNQAVISYKENNGLKYFKIKKILFNE